uniref:Uncharacterized protein n=1 Tax=Chaetoceros debilis TaxID=122233 RepID=A0A7S3QJG5_9STRA
MLNNAYRSIARSALATSRRSVSTTTTPTATATATVYKNAINADIHNNVRAKLLADPATYPLIFILGVAMAGCSGFGVWFLRTSTDVRVDPNKRLRLIRNWSRE